MVWITISRWTPRMALGADIPVGESFVRRRDGRGHDGIMMDAVDRRTCAGSIIINWWSVAWRGQTPHGPGRYQQARLPWPGLLWAVTAWRSRRPLLWKEAVTVVVPYQRESGAHKPGAALHIS